MTSYATYRRWLNLHSYCKKILNLGRKDIDRVSVFKRFYSSLHNIHFNIRDNETNFEKRLFFKSHKLWKKVY